MKKNFYLTTPIYYPSGKLHIGHAYTTIAGDVVKKYKNQNGFETFYLTGMDEHGEKIEQKAKANDISPQTFVDNAAIDIKKLWEKLEIDYDKFIRTTDKDHMQIVTKIFKKLMDNDDIYKDTYTGLYCVSCETYVTESSAVDGNKCPDCGSELKIIEEESYFFRCSKYVDRLVEHMNENKNFILPESRKNEILNNFIKPGLEDLAVSRTSFKWGIPVPGDENHVIYVWIDALSNYITALGYDTKNDELFNKFWPADIHLVGKEIIRFHVIYWPMILMALGLELPKQIFAHGWLLMDEDKMSKSKGNVIYPEFLIDNYGVDTVRYYLMREVAFGSDGQFTPETFIKRINNDLANDLGNLLNRTISMANKYFNGNIANKKIELEYKNELNNLYAKTNKSVADAMEELKFSHSLEHIWKYIAYLNKYVDLNEPWLLAKDENKSSELMQVLFDLLDGLEKVAYLIYPVLPNTAKEMIKQININADLEYNLHVSRETYNVVNKPEPLYPRLDVDEEISKILSEMQKNTKDAKQKIEEENNSSEEMKIDISDFDKVNLKVVEVKDAKKHTNAKKLLVLNVFDGNITKQIVSGIAEFYNPDELVGEKILIVDNLKEVNLRGEKSEGMILTTSNQDKIQIVKMPSHDIGEVLK